LALPYRPQRADYFRQRTALEPLEGEALDRPEPAPGPALRLQTDLEHARLKRALMNLNLMTHNDGDVIVENAEGDIEVQNHNGGIRLTNVAGSAVANTHNGDVRVTLTRIAVDKAMSFVSYNGDVDVTLPASAKANLKLRSDNGEILTDFDVQMRPGAAPQTTRDSRGRNRVEINQSIYGAINGGGPEFELRTYNGNIYVRKGQ
jgi:DUF4097 and DUF4098 domain-containing protein YvlB